MSKNWKTRLIHSDAQHPAGFRSLATPTYRGSTVLFPNAGAVQDAWDQHSVGYTYGLFGTPTTLELAMRICELENGYRAFITPGGQGAIALINLAFLKAGDHVLVPESIYKPNRQFAWEVLRRFGVEVSFYQPAIGAGIRSLFLHVLSVERVRKFKTAPEAYQLGPDAFGRPASELLFVSSNGWDVGGATWFGYSAYWINRANAPA